MAHCEIIAEAGINHCGSWTKALDLVDAAFDAGANAVKFQIYHADRMLKGDKDALKRFELSDEAHKAIAAHAREIGIEWFTSVFDEQALDLAIRCGARRIKIGSGEITNLPLLSAVGASKLPLILSTGMSVMDDIFQATEAYKGGGGKDLSLLHCVSNYPTAPEHCNLAGMRTLKRNFSCPVGWSDHTEGMDAAIVAVGAGAELIEKHLMLAKLPDCPDAPVSLVGDDFGLFVRRIRRAESMLGNGDRNSLQPGELEMEQKARDRWYASES